MTGNVRVLSCLLGLLSVPVATSGFVSPSHHHHSNTAARTSAASPSSSSSSTGYTPLYSSSKSIQESVDELKRVLTREYTSFFNPMYTEYYSKDVTFEDPMTSLVGVEKYRDNVDMLASRTLMGSFLFEDAGIVLHSVTGGDVVDESNEISDIVTRWTLRVTAKVIPWKPTARFTGISVYKLKPSRNNADTGIEIVGQTDYWDSINLKPNGSGDYERVEKGIAISDFLDQLKPGGFQAKQSGPELPYQLLRRGDGYEVRQYPEYAAVSLPYSRRDEGFGSLGAFTRGMNPLAPAIMQVYNSETADKIMSWPLVYTLPGSDSDSGPILPEGAEEKAGQGQWRTMRIETIPSRVVAVAEFNDASMEPVVRLADRKLKEALRRDGLMVDETSSELGVKFAQYDAVYSMGRRRGEVWIDLKDENGHPY